MRNRLALTALLCLLALPARGEPYTHAPEACEFSITFPAEPYKSQRCAPDAPEKCTQQISFTKVFALDATVTVNVSCNKAEDGMYDRYSGDIMQATLAAMASAGGLTHYETGFQQFDGAKQAVILGTGRTGASDKLYAGQLWIGKTSVFSVEAELIGAQIPEADELFAEILKSIKIKDKAPPAAVQKDQ